MILIYTADPQSRPVVIIISHVFHTFQQLAKQSKFQVKIVIATDGNVGIIDDTCLVNAIIVWKERLIIIFFAVHKTTTGEDSKNGLIAGTVAAQKCFFLQ